MGKFTDAGGAAYSSDRMDWETPQALFDELNAEYGFTLDPCSTHANAKCENHYTAEDDGLALPWGGVVFCNPPYGRSIGDWIRKCSEEAARCETIVALVPARTDTRWFHEYIYHRAEVVFLRGRLKFETDGKPGGTAPFPSMLVIWRNDKEAAHADG